MWISCSCLLLNSGHHGNILCSLKKIIFKPRLVKCNHRMRDLPVPKSEDCNAHSCEWL